MPVTVEIPLANLKPLLKRVERLAARARAHGMPDVGLAVGERVDRLVDVPDQFARLRGDTGATREVAVAMVRVELEGTAPWLGEWQVVGGRRRIRQRDKADRVFGFGSIPASIAARDMCCDHCKTKRDRAVTYALSRKDGLRDVEVGASCLADFVGSPGNARVMEGMDLVSTIVREAQEAADPYWRHGGAQEILEEARLVMAVANRVIQDEGWVSSSEARMTGEEPTWRRVASVLELSRSEDGLAVGSAVPLGGDYVMADDAIAWIGDSGEDPFMDDLAKAIDTGLAGRREVAMLSAGMAMYRRHLETRAANEREQALARMSAHVGDKGDRIERIVTVRRMIPFSSQWGGGTIILLSDPDGNLMKWKTASDPRMRVGHCYEVKGTVKAHGSVYAGAAKGAPETELSRVTVLAELGPGVLEAPAPRGGLSEEDASALDGLFAAQPMF